MTRVRRVGLRRGPVARGFGADASHGFSLLEVAVAALLLAIIVAAVAGILSTAGTYAGLGKRGTDAAAIAAAEIERLRDLPYDRIPTGSQEWEVQFSGSTYRVRRVVDPDVPEQGMKRITVEVTYKLGGERSYRTQVIFTDLMRPAPTPTP